MKARKVKGLDPAGSLGDNAERIVRVRLDELCSFMPRAEEPGQAKALHDMRIAAKRLRYLLEITNPCFGEFAESAIAPVKALQDVLGEVHDCDEQIPAVRELIDELLPGGEADGLIALSADLAARRERCFWAFREQWSELERERFRARLEHAVGERARAPDPATIGVE